eukprot:14528298-Ditylum_brightwellii.AAC.1
MQSPYQAQLYLNHITKWNRTQSNCQQKVFNNNAQPLIMAIIKSLHDLGTELKTIVATNANLLDVIQSCSSKKAISAYNFSLQYNLPSPNSLTEVVDGTSQAWSFNTKEQTDSISKCLDKWQYN